MRMRIHHDVIFDLGLSRVVQLQNGFFLTHKQRHIPTVNVLFGGRTYGYGLGSMKILTIASNLVNNGFIGLI